jgi:NADPH:quinone reductase-like Zn-dependent oxidoreductase
MLGHKLADVSSAIAPARRTHLPSAPPRSTTRTGTTMGQTILVTGGAGFIGSHLADLLLREGHHVRALDALSPQVHGDAAATRTRPDYLDPEVELVVGDVRDRAAVDRALQGVDAVYHLAAAVGVVFTLFAVTLNGCGVKIKTVSSSCRWYCLSPYPF